MAVNDEKSYINYQAFEKYASAIEQINKNMRNYLNDIKSKIEWLKSSSNYNSDDSAEIVKQIGAMEPRFEAYKTYIDNQVKWIRNTDQIIRRTVAIETANGAAFQNKGQ